MKRLLSLLIAAGTCLALRPAQAQTFTVNYSSPSSPNCVKTKFGVYQTPFMGTAGIPLPTAMQPFLVEAGVQDLRYEIGWGKGDCFAYNQIGGTATSPTIDFTQLDPFVTMLKTNGVTPLFAVTYCPTPMQTIAWEDEPDNLTSYQSVVQQYVAHYASVIGLTNAYYEVWNEPDIGGSGPNSKEFFDGDQAQYGSVYTAAAAGVRAGAASAKVGGPAVAYDTSYMTSSGMLSQPVDFASIHSYANYGTQIGLLSSALGGRNVPMFVTEYGSYASSCSTCANSTYVAAAQFFEDVKHLLTYNVQKVYWAQWIDDGIGMIFYNLHRKALFNAYKIYQKMLPVTRNTVSPDSSGNVDIMAASSGTKGAVVVWNNGTTAATVTINMTNLPFASGTLNVYRIDSQHADYVSNPSSENLAVTQTGTFGGTSTNWTGSIPGQSVVYLEAVSAAAGGPLASVTYEKTDTTAQGNWEGVYGAQGYNIIDSVVSAPAYATVSVGGTPFIWNSATTDVRALQEPGSSSRFAGGVYSASSLTIDCNLTDGNVHELALYCLDWDSTVRDETIQVVDYASGTVLDQRDMGSFSGGKYLVWKIQGHVQFQVSLNAGANAVVSGMFFDTTVAPPLPTVSALTLSPATVGAGLSSTGMVSLTSAAPVGGALVSLSSSQTYANPGASVTIAAGATSTNFTITTSAITSNATATITASYNSSSKQATLSLVPSASAAFVRLDTLTEGTWKTNYGVDGFSIIENSNHFPAYATVTLAGSPFVWVYPTTDPRALQAAGNTTNRIAAATYGSLYSLDCNLTDGLTHQVALYALDWDKGGRKESIAVLDANTSGTLDTETVSSFTNGDYLVWNIKGHVQFQVTQLAGPNAVVSGIFFGGANAPPVIAISQSGNVLTLTWTGSGALASAPAVTGPWQTIPSAQSGYQTTVNGSTMFFRIQ